MSLLEVVPPDTKHLTPGTCAKQNPETFVYQTSDPGLILPKRQNVLGQQSISCGGPSPDAFCAKDAMMMEHYAKEKENYKEIIIMGKPSSTPEGTKFSMILKFKGDLEAFLTAYAEEHQFRSVQELLTVLVRQYARQHSQDLPRPIKSPANSRRMSWRAPDELDEFLDAFTTAYDFTSKPELVKQIAREFYQAQKTAKPKL
jgi:hypothetical protein